MLLKTAHSTDIHEPTEEQLCETIYRVLLLVEDNYLVYIDSDDPNNYMQAMPDTEDTFRVEYRDGILKRHFKKNNVSISDTIDLFYSYRLQDKRWINKIKWQDITHNFKWVEQNELAHTTDTARLYLVMLRILHIMGYERLRVIPGLSPSGLHWRCGITPASNICKNHGAIEHNYECHTVHWSPEGMFYTHRDIKMGPFGWKDHRLSNPLLAAKWFVGQFPELVCLGKGEDKEYVRWYSQMLSETAPVGLIYAYADWELPLDRIPCIKVKNDIFIPLPPPGDVADN